MKKIVITTFGSLGDIHPLMGLALGLKTQGYSVVFATNTYYQPLIESVGLQFHGIRPFVHIPDNETIRRLFHPSKGAEYLIRTMLMPEIEATYEDLLTAAENADLLITGELVYATPLVAEKLGIPWVSTVLAPITFLSGFDPSVLPGAPYLESFRNAGSGINSFLMGIPKILCKRWAEPVYQLRKKLGLPKGQDPVFDGKHSPSLSLALFSSCFGQPQPDWPKQVRVTGFIRYDNHEAQPLPDRLQDFLDAGDPPIVFTLGSAAVFTAENFHDVSLEAARQLNRRAILLVGENIPPANMPDTVIALPGVPYSQVFNHAAAVVHQGGVGTTAQTLASGKPMLVVPFGFDQFDNAARVCRLGVGRQLPRNRYRVNTLVAGLEALLEEPDYAAKGRQIADVIAPEDGVKHACDAISRLLSDKAPEVVLSSI